MKLGHLHIHVRDRAAAETFYSSWLGMTVAWRRQHLTFMKDDGDFDLALMDDPTPQTMPAWFHFGFRLGSAAEVIALHARMSQSQVPLVRPLYQDESHMSFRCADPDGYAVEIYWEA